MAKRGVIFKKNLSCLCDFLKFKAVAQLVAVHFQDGDLRFETLNCFTYLITNCNSQRTLTVGGSITVQLVSSFISLVSAASVHTKSSLVKLETSCTVILPPMVSVLYNR